MRDKSARQLIHESAAAGDRRRRGVLARQFVLTWLPAIGAIAALISLMLLAFDGPRFIGPAMLLAGVLMATVVRLVARRPHEITDTQLLELDSAANLGGALRSAHWFAAESRQASLGPLGEFHLEQAASRVTGVKWEDVYRRSSGGPAWVKFALSAAAVGVFFSWPARSLAIVDQPDASAAPARAVERALPTILVPKIVEGVRALEAGEAPSSESLTAIGQALELSASDEVVRKQLEELLAASRTWADVSSFWADSEECMPWELRACEERGYNLSRAGLEWAYEGATARARGAERRAQDERSPSMTDARPEQTGANNSGGVVAAASEKGGAESQPVVTDTGGQPTSFSSLLFARPQVGTGSGPPGGPAASQSRTSALAAALRAEVVHAAADTLDPNDDRAPVRRATTSNQSAPNRTGVSSTTTYDRGRAWQPPPIPEVRKSLVHEFFYRPMEPAGAERRP